MKRNGILGIVAVFVMAALSMLPSGCDEPEARSLTIRAFIDGSDVIKVSGGKVWVEHEKFNVPDKPFYVNGKAWTPKWNDKNVSATYEELTPLFKPTDPKKIQLTMQSGRGAASIADMPTAENNQTISIRIDDTDFDGAGWYQVLVTW